MTYCTQRGVWLLAFAIGCAAACDGGSPSGPTPLPRTPPSAPGAPGVTAISPSTGSTARPIPIVITGTGFLAGARVTLGGTEVRVTDIRSTAIAAITPVHDAGPADVVVTNPDGSVGTLRAAFTYSFEEPFTVTPSTNTVDAGGQMSVSWTAPAGRAGDWLAVFRVGASYDDDWWADTNGAASGTEALIAPTRPGLYEFRYLLEGSFLDAARSSPFTVR